MQDQSDPIRQPASEYIAELDGLRAISILMVMLGHAGWSFVPAAMGVTIFFCISGFLICRLLLQERLVSGTIRIRSFYLRRSLRLYPELITYLVVLLVIGWSLGWSMSPWQIAASLFYFTNYLQIFSDVTTSITYITRPLWSLAVEEHFYLLFPMFVLAMRGRQRAIADILLGVMLAICVLRLALYSFWAAPHFYFDYATESRIDAIAGGCIIACALSGNSRGKIARLIVLHGPACLALALASLLAAVAIRSPSFRETWRYTLEAVGSALLVASLIYGNNLDRIRVVLRASPLLFVGRISYAAYLYHLLVYTLISDIFSATRIFNTLISIPLSFVAASASFYLIDRPIRTLRKRLHRRHNPVFVAPTYDTLSSQSFDAVIDQTVK